MIGRDKKDEKISERQKEININVIYGSMCLKAYGTYRCSLRIQSRKNYLWFRN